MYTLLEKAQLLKSCPLFETLPFEALKLLAATSPVVTCHAGEVLFQEGQEQSDSYVLLEGEAEAVTCHNEHQVRLARFQRPDILGEFAMLAGVPRTATVFARGELVALRVSRESFLEAMRTYPEVGIRITALLVKRLLDLRQRFLHLLELHPEDAHD